jgi:hypothetical protein
MAADPKIRASDEDRDRAVSLLREHHAAGRLDAEEFNERLDKAYAAKTLGELDEIMADLPAIDLYRLPHDSLPRYGRPKPGGSSFLEAAAAGHGGVVRAHGRFSPAWASAWGSWFTCTVLCFVIWALTGAGYPWPLWVAAPWGAVMLGTWVTGGHPGGGRRRDHRELPGGQDQPGGGSPGP